MSQKNELPSLIEGFFSKRLVSQRNVSAHTIASYRDAFRLLLAYAQKELHRPPTRLSMEDLNAELIGRYLDMVERERGNGAKTRNLRLTAIRSFFRYAALEAPEHAGLIQRVLAIPPKRYERKIVGFLTQKEATAILASVDQSCWRGMRDYALLLTTMQTGLRLAEVTSLRHKDITLGPGAYVHCQGKGRKERCTPLTRSTARVLKAWCRRQKDASECYLFPSSHGGRLSHDAVQDLVQKHVAAASIKCSSLKGRKITPHMLRHTAAMELLQAGIDRSLIAIWLGHESVGTTQVYLDANLTLKEQILALSHQQNGRASRFKPGDQLLDFLRKL
jgi:integrase/recombinase XerD